MLRFVLADAEVELAPNDIAGHPAIRATAVAQGRKPSEVLLDQNQHSAALAKIPDGKRRGRPDIVHITLLTLLESPLCKRGGLEVAIHTRNSTLVRVRRDTRLPRSEARFQGLLAKVLRDGVSNDDPAPWMVAQTRCGPRQVLEAFHPPAAPLVRLDETAGPPQSPLDIVARAQPATAAGALPDLTLVLGAFPSGGFSPAWLAAAPQAASLWSEPLVAWAVAGELCGAYRARWGPAA